MADVKYLETLFEYHPDFPKPGVNFCDILPVLRDPLAFESLISHILHHIFTVTLPKLREGVPDAEKKSVKIDAIVGLDARGFLFGPQLAQRLGAAFLPVRKRGKLPGENVQAEYVKEYGTDVFELPSKPILSTSGKPANIIVVDDLIATGGSAGAAGELVRKVGGKTIEYIFVVAIPFLKGEEKLDAPSYQ
ncbi:PRTase-like protein [Microstroma glucosiphilum]|uniref:adenine phosphoribosyltransferase n=1 Tax=Pseudomicrostroma glucosiphilum TaxID=1684307 RepID=A0A316UEZ7_9BASI|nr:PRTase-like protein [Pseudomicrostroma glucosiphilum]PWN23812.1 PRTase-like protein [Pseudomicrostroma glucosiphilum]